jgi:TolA-binding protein
MRFRLFLSAFLIIPVAAFSAPQREIVELGRDVANLREEVRALQTSMAEKMGALTALVQQSIDANANASKAAAAGLESRIADQMQKQQAPVAVMGTKVDQMSGEFQSLRESLQDLSSRLGKVDQKLVDLKNQLTTIPPPPGPTGASAAPAIPAGNLFETAVRDQMTGKPDLALKEFSDYVQMYGDTENAPEAQYKIGQIHWEQNDLANAVKDFDAVLEKYPESTKTAEAMFMKGQALAKMGRPTDAQKEYKTLLAKYPHNELAPKACTKLKELGYNCPAPAAASRKRD